MYILKSIDSFLRGRLELLGKSGCLIYVFDVPNSMVTCYIRGREPQSGSYGRPDDSVPSLEYYIEYIEVRGNAKVFYKSNSVLIYVVGELAPNTVIGMKKILAI